MGEKSIFNDARFPRRVSRRRVEDASRVSLPASRLLLSRNLEPMVDWAGIGRWLPVV